MLIDFFMLSNSNSVTISLSSDKETLCREKSITKFGCFSILNTKIDFGICWNFYTNIWYSQEVWKNLLIEILRKIFRLPSIQPQCNFIFWFLPIGPLPLILPFFWTSVVPVRRNVTCARNRVTTFSWHRFVCTVSGSLQLCNWWLEWVTLQQESVIFCK